MKMPKNKRAYLSLDMTDEKRRLAACKTKEDLNDLFKGRTIIVQNNSEWNNERCEFVEMVGEGERSNWKMRVKTHFGTHLDLSASEAMIVTQTLTTTEAEAEKIRKSLS